jgi:hypothetical protein
VFAGRHRLLVHGEWFADRKLADLLDRVAASLGDLIEPVSEFVRVTLFVAVF